MTGSAGTCEPRAINLSILRAAGTVAGAAVVAKLVATIKEFVVAGMFGRSDATDAFLMAFLLPNLLVNLIAESMNQALVPTLIRVRLREGAVAAQKLLSNAVLSSCALLTGVSAGVAVLAQSIFPLMASNFSAPKMALAVRLFYVLLPMVFLSGVASNCTAVLNAEERFALPSFCSVIMPAITIVGTVALHHWLGIWAVAYATLAGSVVHAGVLVVMMEAHGLRFRPRFNQWDEASREVRRQFGPVFLSSVVASGGLVLDQSMAAMLPSGSVSALVFANRFASVALLLLGGAVSTALTPYFSAMVARRNWLECRSTLRTWARGTAVVSLLVALLLICGARSLVRLTLQHGAFGAQDGAVVAFVLVMYSIQIPFFVVSRVFYRFIVAMRRSDLVFFCGLLNLGLDAVLNLVLMRVMGVAGIALATSLWTVSTLGFLWFWAERILAAAEREHGEQQEVEAALEIDGFKVGQP